MSQTEPNCITLEDRDGKSYDFTFYMLDPDSAWDYSLMFMKLAAPGAATLAVAAQTGIGDDMDVSSLISGLVDKLEDKEVTKLMKLLMAKTHYNNTPLEGQVYSGFFKNKLSMQWLLFLSLLEAQFGDFFPDILDWLKRKVEERSGLQAA